MISFYNHQKVLDKQGYNVRILRLRAKLPIQGINSGPPRPMPPRRENAALQI
jgi:hypothetical protein